MLIMMMVLMMVMDSTRKKEVKMPKQRDDYRPCSDLDIRAAALRATHERLRELDQQGVPTVGKFGIVLREEKAKLRALGESMAEKGACTVMTWDQLKKAANKFAKEESKTKGTK
jgi:hypothetical protein